MAYVKKNWKDYPSTDTLVTASDLNRIEQGIADAQNDGLLEAPSTTGTAGQVLTLGADGSTTWETPQAKITVDSALSDTSENPVQNKVIKGAIDAKQDTLTTQTAYTSKGTTKKVPQITTNALGQVTNITEVDIDGGGSSAEVYTKAEWDALVTKPADGTEVIIKDDGIGTGGSGTGTTVEANPSGTATDELSKIKVGSTIYSIPQGGGLVKNYLGKVTLASGASTADIKIATDSNTISLDAILMRTNGCSIGSLIVDASSLEHSFIIPFYDEISSGIKYVSFTYESKASSTESGVSYTTYSYRTNNNSADELRAKIYENSEG